MVKHSQTFTEGFDFETRSSWRRLLFGNRLSIFITYTSGKSNIFISYYCVLIYCNFHHVGEKKRYIIICLSLKVLRFKYVFNNLNNLYGHLISFLFLKGKCSVTTSSLTQTSHLYESV